MIEARGERMREGKESDESREAWRGKNVTIVTGTSGADVLMGLMAEKYYKSLGARPRIWSEFPQTFVDKFWTGDRRVPLEERLKDDAKIPIRSIRHKFPDTDCVVMTGIPLDYRYPDPRQTMQDAEWELRLLASDIAEMRAKAGKPDQDINVVFWDHAPTSGFDEAVLVGPEHEAMVKKLSELAGVLVRHHQGSIAEYAFAQLGENKKLARLAMISDHDPRVLPVTQEEEDIARGFSMTVRERGGIEKAIEMVRRGEWGALKEKARELDALKIPVLAGFGDCALIELDDVPPGFFNDAMARTVAKVNISYGIAAQFHAEDTRIGRPAAFRVVALRDWKREDKPTLRQLLQDLPESVRKSLRVSAENFAMLEVVPPEGRVVAEVMGALIERLGGKELPDFSKVKSIVKLGDPNSGKSVFDAILSESLRQLTAPAYETEKADAKKRLYDLQSALAGGEALEAVWAAHDLLGGRTRRSERDIQEKEIKAIPAEARDSFFEAARAYAEWAQSQPSEMARTLEFLPDISNDVVADLDLDMLAPTPPWYLEAKIAQERLAQQDADVSAKRELADAFLRVAEEVRKLRKPKVNDMERFELYRRGAETLRKSAESGNLAVVLGDLGGGIIKKNADGSIDEARSNRMPDDTNRQVVKEADGAIIICNNAGGIEKWKAHIEDINRERAREGRRPIEVWSYLSQLEGGEQDVGNLITNLDRKYANRTFMPGVFAFALAITKGIKNRQGQ